MIGNRIHRIPMAVTQGSSVAVVARSGAAHPEQQQRYGEQRYGQREPYNTGQRYSRDYDRGGGRGNERSVHGGELESGFDRGSSFDRGPFEDNREPPRYFGTGNYGDGGASYAGGFDEREGARRYGSLYGAEESERYERMDRYGAPERRYRSGPKGYTRSDERVREEISERLMMADSIDSSEVSLWW